MKSKFGTALALAAVLLTGTAAAAINTQALISPTESTLGTAATTLLPADQAASADPAPVENVSPDQTVIANQDQNGQTQIVAPSNASVQSSPTPAKTGTAVSATSNGATVVYGNPNPSNGDDEDDDEDDDDDDEDDD